MNCHWNGAYEWNSHVQFHRDVNAPRIQTHSSVCSNVLLFELWSTEFSRLSYNLDLNSISSISKFIFLHDRSCTAKGEECLHRLYHSTKENQSNWHEIELYFLKVHRVKFDWFKMALIRRFISICFFKINDNNSSWDHYFYAYLNFYFILVLCLLSDIVFIVYIILYFLSRS